MIGVAESDELVSRASFQLPILLHNLQCDFDSHRWILWEEHATEGFFREKSHQSPRELDRGGFVNPINEMCVTRASCCRMTAVNRE